MNVCHVLTCTEEHSQKLVEEEPTTISSTQITFKHLKLNNKL